MEEISMKELLRRTVDLIGAIEVPVRYGEQIARPLCEAVANIEQCIAVIPDVKEGDANVV